MGTTKSVEEFSKKIVGLATATERHAKEIVLEGAKVTKTSLLAAAAAKGVKPGGKIAGKRWSVRYDLQAGAEPTALVRIVGPFHLVESNTKAHTITPKGATKGRRGGKKALRIGQDVRAAVHHPGTKGKHIFQTGKVIAGKEATKAMAAALRAVLIEALK